MSEVQELIEYLETLSPEELDEVTAHAAAEFGQKPWMPNLGPQQAAFFNEADDLYYGGQAGGGKSDLILGLSLTEHRNSLVLRRFTDDARELAERLMDITGTRAGFNGQHLWYRTDDGRRIDFGGCKEETDKQRYKGRPHDLIGFDEIPDFLESQFRFIKAWNRSVDPEQRCRVVCAGNPPTNPEGVWVIQYWGPWLDPEHPEYPVPDGELRWFTTVDGKEDEMVDGKGPHLVNGEKIMARSRTFIRSRLQDNPDLAQTDYDATLAQLPPELRAAYRDGRFDMSLKDQAYQVIPSAWLNAAVDRWLPDPPQGIPMCAMGADIAQGGQDNTVLAPRHDGWFAPLIKVAGAQTPDGPSVAGLIMTNRRHGAEVIIDMGGGYGGSARDHLIANGIKAYPYKGAKKSERMTKDRQMGFSNTRSEAYWRFREALDPSEYQGSPIALPNDKRLLAGLRAPTFKLVSNKIQITPKVELTKNLGFSPDEADAVVMSWFRGPKAKTHLPEWRPDQRVGNIGGIKPRLPRVNTGRPHRRRR